MIILITGVYNDTRNIPRLLVSHGIDSNTDKPVILPNVHPAELGAIIDPEYQEWVIHDKSCT